MRYLANTLILALIILSSACEQVRYDPGDDAQQAFNTALSRASESDRYLMVVFGADWCPDCRALYDQLHTTDIRTYMQAHMDFLTVDIGDRDRNIAFAESLGVTISNGIPVAVFFDPDGKAIGTTNEGQLEPSRYLTSRQILRFVSAVVNKREITRPTPVKPKEEQT